MANRECRLFSWSVGSPDIEEHDLSVVRPTGDHRLVFVAVAEVQEGELGRENYFRFERIL